MIIYNVTAKVTWRINEAFLEWMKEIHTREVLATGLFFEYRILRLLETDDTEGPTYAIQYSARNEGDYNQYIREHSVPLREKVTRQWGQEYLAYRSVLQLVD